MLGWSVTRDNGKSAESAVNGKTSKSAKYVAAKKNRADASGSARRPIFAADFAALLFSFVRSFGVCLSRRRAAPTLVSRQAHILRSFGYFGIVSTYNLIVIFVKVLDN